jgi:hypothetical protein
VHGVGVDSVTGTVGSTLHGVTGTVNGLVDTHSLLGGVTGTVGGTVHGAGVGNVTGDLGLTSGQAHTETHADVNASHHGLLDGLL